MIEEFPLTILGVEVTVDVVFKVLYYGASNGPLIHIERIIGPRGTDIYDQLRGPVSMDRPKLIDIAGKLYWTGYNDVDHIRDVLKYRVECGDIA